MNETDKQLIRRAKQLAHKECCNLFDGFCVDYDHPCFLVNTRYPSIHEGAIDCDWFLLNVLPLERDLNQVIWAEIYREDDEEPQAMKKCAICKKHFIPTSNRQKYCAACRPAADRARGRKKQRRYESSRKQALNLTD